MKQPREDCIKHDVHTSSNERSDVCTASNERTDVCSSFNERTDVCTSSNEKSDVCTYSDEETGGCTFFNERKTVCTSSSISTLVEPATVDCYAKGPGLCIIINQELFYADSNILSSSEEKERQATNNDKEKLKNTFHQLGAVIRT